MAKSSKANDASASVSFGRLHETMYPAEKRIFQLKELFIPPKKYDAFLRQCAESFKELVLEHHKCKTLEEVFEREGKNKKVESRQK